MKTIKSNSIDKKNIKFISYILYNGYERVETISSKFKKIKVVGKLKDKNKIPNFENILEDLLIILPYEGNEDKKELKDWVIMEIIK